MTEHKLPLTKLFKSNSLKLYETPKQQATPAHGSLCYVRDEVEEGPIKEILTKGEKWKPGGSSFNNLIELSDEAYDVLCDRCIIVGPNTTTKTQTVRIVQNGDKIRITAYGWGSSVVLFWEDDKKYFWQYLCDHQCGEVCDCVLGTGNGQPVPSCVYCHGTGRIQS